MKDLTATATVRRILLELGYVLQPDHSDALVGPLSLWIAEPRPDLNGQTPLAALEMHDGEERLRQCLAKLIGQLPTNKG